MLEPYLQLVLTVIAETYDERSDCCYMNLQYIANMTNYSETYVLSILNQLHSSKIIEIQESDGDFLKIVLTDKGKKIADKNINNNIASQDEKKNLFASNGERNLYNLLKQAAGKDIVLTLKTRVADSITNYNLLSSEYKKFAMTAHFDFMFAKKNQNKLTPIVVIEYDGNHDENQIRKDKIKNEICQMNGIAIVRVNSNDIINYETLFCKLLSSLN